MKILFCGEAGVGKSDLAYKIYEKLYYVHIVDSDEIRKQFKNFDYTIKGRNKNIQQCSEIGNILHNLNRHIIFAVQAPFPNMRKKYFSDCKIYKITNKNNTKIIPNEIKPNYDYSDIKNIIEYQDYKDNIDKLIDKIFPKVLIIGRFQPLHKGHDIIFQSAIKLSPIIDVAIRKEDGDIFSLKEVKQMIKKQYPGIRKIFYSPKLKHSSEKWEFVKNYDYIIQGNPEVINKFKNFITIDQLIFIPRIGNISGTKLREQYKNK